MKLLFSLLFSLIGCIVICRAAEDLHDAARECGNIHHIDFASLPHSEAVYVEGHCKLRCSVGNKTLSDEAVNEGWVCPSNPNGICHGGKCLETHHNEQEALAECGNLHHLDVHTANGRGSYYGNNHCYIRCVINGVTESLTNLNEGLPCPKNTAGTCHNGYCVRKEVTHIHHTTQKIVVHSITTTAHPALAP